MRPTARGLGLLAAGAVLAFIATSMHSSTVGSLAALPLATLLVALVWVGLHRLGWPRIDLHRVVQPRRPVVGQWAQVQLQTVPPGCRRGPRCVSVCGGRWSAVGVMVAGTGCARSGADHYSSARQWCCGPIRCGWCGGGT